MKSKIIIGIVLLLVLFGFFVYQYFQFADGQFHLVFCDVGQGDAIFIKTSDNHTILVDSGPDSSVTECLSRHLPFWHRTIDLAILSHPHQDHLAGFISVLQSYRITQFATEKLRNITPDFKRLEAALSKNNVPVLYLYQGDTFSIEKNVGIRILAPTSEFIHETSPNGIVGERAEFASVIPYIAFGNISFLLTGDSQTRELLTAIQSNGLHHVTILQTPHHGSKTGLAQSILDAVHPEFSVISVGASNQYNLPNPATVTLLEKNAVPFAMTKTSGDVEFVSDGADYHVSGGARLLDKGGAGLPR